MTHDEHVILLILSFWQYCLAHMGLYSLRLSPHLTDHAMQIQPLLYYYVFSCSNVHVLIFLTL